MKRIQKSAQAILKNCLESKRDESVLVLYQKPFHDYANIIYNESITKSPQTFLLQIPDNIYKPDITDFVSPFMNSMDIIIALTMQSISFWDARIQANQNGARIVCLPNISQVALTQLGKTNFKRIHFLSKKISDVLSISKVVNITAPNGTHLTIPITNHQGYAETGLINKSGNFSNLPAGEACIIPEQNECEGELIVNSGLEYQPDDPDKLIIQIKNGRAVRVTGGISAKKLRQKLTRLGTNSRNILEFGIGTNESAKNTGNSLEDQKVLGNIHLSLGDPSQNLVNSQQLHHLPGIVYKATVKVRGKKIIDNGKLMLDV